MKVLLYCTKGKDHLVKDYDLFEEFVGFKTTNDLTNSKSLSGISQTFNGKIIAECECDLVEKYEMEFYHDKDVQQSIRIFDKFETEYWGEDCYETIITNEYSDEEIEDCKLLKDSCLTFDELGNYVCPKGGVNNFYALHLSNVNVFDEPKELSDYCIIDTTVEASSKYRKDKYSIYGELVEKKVFKAPQNMQVVFENGILTEHYTNFSKYKYVLISVQPQHLCKILNGKKTIEVRKSILKALKVF